MNRRPQIHRPSISIHPLNLNFISSFIIIFAFFLLLIIPSANAIGIPELDNALLGQPNISCHPDTIEMRFRTKRPFTGKIYVQGHYNNPDCRVDFSQAGGADHDGRGGIRLHHGSCNMDRQRMVRPEGMQFSTVLVISFHQLFVTKTDRAFHINCMYREADQDVDAGMTVGDVTPDTVQNDMPAPICHYTIRKDELNGEILKFARVGDLIVHRWECDSEMYGMLVHSCYVEDGQGDRVQVIDERGCHKDPNVLGDPTYSEALNLAYRESYVFKFRDRLGVRFSCEIKLCVKADDGCAGITPPDCQGVRFQNSRDDPKNNISIAKNRIRRHSPTSRTVDADLISQYVFVLDEPVEGEDEGDDRQQFLAKQSASKNANLFAPAGQSAVCISSVLFAALAILVLLIFGLASAIVGHSICRQYKRNRDGAELFSACSSAGSIGRSSGVASAGGCHISPGTLFLRR